MKRIVLLLSVLLASIAIAPNQVPEAVSLRDSSSSKTESDLSIDTTLASDSPAQLIGTAFTGRYQAGGGYDPYSFETSADGTAVIQINVATLLCYTTGPHYHTFSVDLDPGIPISDNRFSATDIPVTFTPDPGHTHSLNIDGVFFDGDGDGSLEQALGGLSFVSDVSRCSGRWWATAIAPDLDSDGWSDAAEQRLGSSTTSYLRIPEHREVPTTPLYGTRHCQDFTDNDGDGAMDGAEPDGPDTGVEPDCMPPLAPIQPLASALAGRYQAGGGYDPYSFKTSADGTAVIQINVARLLCYTTGPHYHTFSVDLDPGIPISDNRFSATDIPVTFTPDPGHTHSLDIDGVFFDADGDGSLEQALGALSFVSDVSRCSGRWWATAIAPDLDSDGWSDPAEQRLGSSTTSYLRIPEHREVPTTPLYGTHHCQDFTDNDGDGAMDAAEPDGPDLDLFPDCFENISSIYLPSVVRSAP